MSEPHEQWPDAMGLSVIILTGDAERCHGALTMAAAHAAMGQRTRIFFHAPALPLLVPPHTAPEDQARTDAGLPTLAQLIGDLPALGAELSACQSGLAVHGLHADSLPDTAALSGPIAFLGQIENDRLCMI